MIIMKTMAMFWLFKKKSCVFVVVVIVWSDLRTEETVEKLLDRIPNRDPYHCKQISGLPISPYFSAMKIMWLKDNVPEINEAFAKKTCLVGTIDTWLIWVSKSLATSYKSLILNSFSLSDQN